MRTNPAESIIKKEKLSAAAKVKVDKITRIVALVVAFVSVFFFVIKIMFL